MHYLIKHKLNTDTCRSKVGEKEEEQTIQVNAAKTLALIHNRVAYRIFFMGGGHTLVRPLRGLVAYSPRKFFIFYVGL